MNTLQQRLTEGRIHGPGTPLTEVWKVQEVKAEGCLLRASVKPIWPGRTNSLDDILQSLWYLYPNQGVN